MHATLTSKGQLTLPKVIRDRLGLAAGSRLDFQLLPDNTMTVRHVTADALRLRGIVKSPHARPLTVEEMDAGIAEHVQKFVTKGAKVAVANLGRKTKPR